MGEIGLLTLIRRLDYEADWNIAIPILKGSIWMIWLHRVEIR